MDAGTTGIIRVSSTAEDAAGTALINHLTTNKTSLANPGTKSISRLQDGKLDPRPTSGDVINKDLAPYPAGDAFFTTVDYKGAFPEFAAGMWMTGWSTLARNGHLKDLTQPNTVLVNDNSIQPCMNVTWTKDNVYIVDGLTFVEDCATLTIEAGTVVKFTPRPDLGNPSALVIARGGKIIAQGTATAPIIFTAESDDVTKPTDLGPKDNALWGGLVILGKGITQKNGNAIVNVEGIPTTEPRGVYGGTDNTDNSGILKYVSIRHGGRLLASGSELNGLTLGGVGSGTTLEYIEIYANSDDGIEFFGGAPNLKYAVVAFAEDDSYDWDEVYTGKGQFWFSIQRDDIADAGGELDGTTPDDLTPYSNPKVFNWTHIGSGSSATAANPIGWNLRAGTAGTIANSVLTEMKGKLIEVQDKAVGVNDAYAKLVSGELKILNNVLYRPGGTMNAGTTGIIRVSSTAEDAPANALINHLTTNKNSLLNPNLVSINRNQQELLDPRACPDAAAYITERAPLPANDPFFSLVNFKGAFDSEWDKLWIRNWTALDRNNHLVKAPKTCAVATEDEIKLRDNVKIYPNPTSDIFIIESTLDSDVRAQIFDINGKQVSVEMMIEKNKNRKVSVGTLSSGLYIILLTNETGDRIAKKLVVEK